MVTWSEEQQWASVVLSKEDVDDLNAAIHSMPNVGHHVIHTGRGDSGLSLLTSRSANPEAKRGDALFVRLDRNGWTVERVVGWKQNLHETIVVMGALANVM